MPPPTPARSPWFGRCRAAASTAPTRVITRLQTPRCWAIPESSLRLAGIYAAVTVETVRFVRALAGRGCIYESRCRRSVTRPSNSIELYRIPSRLVLGSLSFNPSLQAPCRAFFSFSRYCMAASHSSLLSRPIAMNKRSAASRCLASSTVGKITGHYFLCTKYLVTSEMRYSRECHQRYRDSAPSDPRYGPQPCACCKRKVRTTDDSPFQA